MEEKKLEFYKSLDFMKLGQAINRKDMIGAKQVLALMVAKRAKFLNAK